MRPPSGPRADRWTLFALMGKRAAKEDACQGSLDEGATGNTPKKQKLSKWPKLSEQQKMANEAKVLVGEAGRDGFRPATRQEYAEEKTVIHPSTALQGGMGRCEMRGMQELDAFNKFFDDEDFNLWDHIVQATNEHLKSLKESGVTLAYKRPLTKEELSLVFMLRVQMILNNSGTTEASFNNLNLSRYLVFRKFEFISANMRAEPDELSRLIR